MNNREHFLKKEKGPAIEEAQKRKTNFMENLDGKSFVPKAPPTINLEVRETKKVRKPKR